MDDVAVLLGNTAPTTSVRKAVAQRTAERAGALGSRDADGWYVLQQEPTGAKAAVTSFTIPGAYSTVDAVRDIALAFGSQHSVARPEWVYSADEVAARLIAEHFSALHQTEIPLLSATKIRDRLAHPPVAGGAIQATGRDLWAAGLGDVSGAGGTTTSAPTATGIADTGKAWTTNQWVGHDVFIGGVVGTVLSNTATALTVARWETPGSRSGATAGTPVSGVYSIGSGQAPAAWVALSANATAPSTGGADATLPGEITTAGSGFLRKVLVFGHTAGTNTYTLTGTYTATASDTFPQDVLKLGVLQAQNGGRLLYETLLAATFRANQSGDSVQVTDTVTGT